MNINKFNNYNELKCCEIKTKSKACCCGLIVKSFEHGILSLPGNQKSIKLLAGKPFQFFWSQWIWGDNYVAVPLAGRIKPFYASVNVLSKLTGIDRSVLQSLNEQAIAQIINCYLYFGQDALRRVFFKLPTNRQADFMTWLDVLNDSLLSKKISLINRIDEACLKNTVLPWSEILDDPKLIELLKEMSPTQTDCFILENTQVQVFLRQLTAKQLNLLVARLQQNLTFTSNFLVQLSSWDQQPNERFQVQPSGNIEFDQKLQRLVDFLDQEQIPSNIGVPILTAFFLQPGTDLKTLYPLLTSIKTYKEKLNATHLFYLIHAEPSVKAQLIRPDFLTLLQKGKVDVNMLVGALKKIDKKLKSLPLGQSYYEKKKRGQHYGFTIDKEGHYFIRTYPLGRGTFKKVAKAVSDIEKKTIVLSFHSKTSLRMSPEHELAKEEKILNRRLRKIMPPFISTQVASNNLQPPKNNKLFAVQLEMSGDGNCLIQGPPKQILYVITDVMQSLVELHQSGFYHADFKPGNFLFKGDPLDPSKPIKGYLHDFGLTHNVGESQIAGTKIYIPPETMYSFNSSSGEVDAYAVGVSLIEMLVGVKTFNSQKAFYEALSQNELEDFIDRKFADLNKSKFSEEEQQIMIDLVNLAKQLLILNPQKRLSCETAFAQLTELKNNYRFPSLPLTA